MIRRLGIRGLVVIDEAEIEPAPGLTAITGETGAGKTVVAQALSLLVGGGADSKAVRPGARHALVEATLALPEAFWTDLEDDDPALAARDLVDAPDEVVVARRVPSEGRARALIDGQTTTRAAAASIAGRLVRFSSQHEGRRLVSGSTQIAILDAYAGPAAQGMARELAGLRRDVRTLERQIDEIRRRRDEAERERAALEELVAAVDAAELSSEDESALRVERDRLRHVDRLMAAAHGAAEALAPESGEGGALDGVGVAGHELDGVVDVDPQLAGPRDRLREVEALLQDASGEIRGYLTSLEADPARLDFVEDRLATYDRLSRRYGPGTDEGLARADGARQALADLDLGEEGDRTRLDEHRALVDRARELSAGLGSLRREAAPRLETAVMQELADLAMENAQGRIEGTSDEASIPADRAQILLRANPGLPEAPLADVASGGELSRVLLALHGVAAAAEPHATWVFDEVDAGVGGVTGTAVAAKLRALAEHRQVIVITHLPQVAAVADRHYRLEKGVDDEGRATTTVTALREDTLVDELVRMLGSDPGDATARAHAEELLARRPGGTSAA